MGGSLALMSEVLQLSKPGFEADLKRKKPYFPVTNGHILTIFAYEQRLLSIEMKTKIVQHVPTINISI